MENNESVGTYLDGRVTVVIGDLTRQAVDAIVNAANSELLGGAGVDGAIHRAGGGKIRDYCIELRRTQYPNGLPTGEAVMTPGGNLPAKYVIHTVGPRYGRNGGRDAELLAASYRNSLKIAAEKGLKTIAFPSISTGVYDYPREQAAAVSSEAIEDFLSSNDTIDEVRLVFFLKNHANVFVENQRFSGPSSSAN